MKAGDKVKCKSTGRIRTVRKVVAPSKGWKKTHPGNWNWLYLEGQAGGFASDYFQKVK